MMRGYGDRQRSFQQVSDLFNETFPHVQPINKSTVKKTVDRFNNHGVVEDLPRSGRPKTATDDDN